MKKILTIEDNREIAEMERDFLEAADFAVTIAADGEQGLAELTAVSRDLALLLDQQVEFAQIESIARQTEKKLLKKVELFDVYEGKNLPEGKKSYAVNFILQDETKTLNDKQIDAIMQKRRQYMQNFLHIKIRFFICQTNA